MRTDSLAYATANQALDKRPRYVINIEFPTGSLYLTSHTGITSVPGTVLEGVVKSPTVTSQKIIPDQGSFETGNAQFEVVDVVSAFTSAIRTKLAAGKGLKGHTTRFYRGFEGMDFTEFALEATQIVSEAIYEEGTYSVSCRDISRALRKDLFIGVTTTLAGAIGTADTTIQARDTTLFVQVKHDAGYTDAPSATVGYIKIKDEIIRYTGTDGTHFVGCTRGALGSLPAAYAYDANVALDRQEQIEEYVYLEGPAVKILYAILTGTLYNDTASLPAHWHCGIASSFVRQSDFTAIGNDLWNPTDPQVGIPCRFAGLDKTDGKKFYGQELLTLIGCYSPIYSDGTIGLKRMATIGPTAASILVLDESNSVQAGSLRHAMDSLHNHFRIDWNWNGRQFTHRNVFFDSTSRGIHGTAEVYAREFKGLHASRHTDGFIFKMLDMLRDRYAGPPEIMRVQLLHLMNALEVGDVVRVKYATVRDYAGPVGAMDRAFEIQGKSDNGTELTLDLFGSTALPSVESPTGTTGALPDAFYNSAGVALSTVVTIVANHVTAAPGTPVNGGTTLDASGSIFYHLGDLTIDAGVTLKIGANWQLRVRGFLQIDGTINGKGNGKAGVADSGGTLITSVPDTANKPILMNTIAGVPGYVGNSRGVDGAQYRQKGRTTGYLHTVDCSTTVSQYPTAPQIALSVSGSVLTGLEGKDLRGGGGGPGGRAVKDILNQGIGQTNGGAGVAGGAGLCIVSRGGGFGIAGTINLDGNDSAATSQAQFNTYPGAGGAGGPGTLYWMIDGGSFSVPTPSAVNFSAKCGAVPVNGTPLTAPTVVYDEFIPKPYAGFNGPISAIDHFNDCYRPQYIPAPQTATADQDLPPPAPIAIILTPSPGFIDVGVESPLNLAPPVVTRIYESITNNLPDAVQVAEGRLDSFTIASTGGVTKYFWASNVNTITGRESVFYPTGPTTLAVATALSTSSSSASLIGRGNVQVSGNTATKVGGVLAWDSDAYGLESSSGGAVTSFKAGQNNLHVMGGLNSDPTTDSSYLSIDYAWYANIDGIAYIYESGNLIGSQGAYTASTLFAIVYSEGRVQYFMDGALKRTALTTAGRTFFFDSSFYDPGASLTGISFGALDPAFETTDGHTVFLETWEHQNWPAFYESVVTSGATVTYPTNGDLGGRVIRAAGAEFWIAHSKNIPFDPNVTYRIIAKVRRISGGSVGTAYVYIGFVGVAADGVTLIATNGNNSHSGQHYNCMNGYEFSVVAANTWVTAVGYVRGLANPGGGVAAHVDAPTTMHVGVRYIRPLVILNYSNGTGTQECDFIKIERLVTPDDSDNTNKKRLVPDAEFALATDTTYWYQERTGSTVPSISLTGGNIYGRASFTCDGGTKVIASRRNPAIQGVIGEYWTVRMRWRRTSTITFSSTGYFRAFVARHNINPSSAAFTTSYSAMFQLGGIAMNQTEVNARTVNVWQEDSGVCLVNRYDGYSAAGAPYLACVAIIESQFTTGSIEIDFLDASPGDGSWFMHTRTASTDLTSYDAFSVMTYDSASPGTLDPGSVLDSKEGMRVKLVQAGAGALTIAAASSLGELRSSPNLITARTLAGKYATAFFECKRDASGSLDFYLTGELA